MKRILTALCMLAALPLAAQQHSGPWSLQDCIRYALEHSISVKQQAIAAEQAAIEVETAQWARVPGLSASASQNYSFGRGLSADNTYVNTNTASTGFDLGTSLNIFSGFRQTETIRLRKLDLETANANLERARNDISVAVARAYVQVLYDMEILGVAQRQIEIDSLQVERLAEMLRNGKASAVELSQQKAALEQGRYTLTQAQNSLSLDILSLTQLLELPSPEGFTVAVPSSELRMQLLENPDDIYAEAVETRPEIRAEQLRLQGFDSQIRLAKSALYPSLSLSGGVGSNYYRTDGYDFQPFREQIRNNFSQFVGLSLNVPIFNKFATRGSIRSAQLGREAQALTLQNAKNSLYKEIQQAYYNAVAARSRYYSSSQAAEAADESFALVQAKYEAGKASITEFNESKNAALKSGSDLAQARYEWLFQFKLLEFYKGVGF